MIDLKTQLKKKPNPSSELIDKMLKQVGSTDPELRDQLIYTQFSNWIGNQQLNNEQIKRLLNTCLQNISFHLGEKENDSIFKRSFSILLCTECIQHYNELNKVEYDYALQMAHMYLNEELDLRGYVEAKGWAHGIAHCADFLVALLSNSYYHQTNIIETLHSIQTSLFTEMAFVDDETDRLAAPVKLLCDKFPHQQPLIKTWINSLPALIADLQSKDISNQNLYFYRTRTNVVHFLSSLYFELLQAEHRENEEIIHSTYGVIQRLRKMS